MSERGYEAKRLHDDVWCMTCQHAHIPMIPVVTYACRDCGFGAWGDTVAAAHATSWPEHIVYGNHHQTVPLADPVCLMETQHITPTCRANRTDEGAWTEAVRRLREIYDAQVAHNPDVTIALDIRRETP